MIQTISRSAKPFIKWVGGKSQLLPELEKRIPRNYSRYFEPFIGGGALFFSLEQRDAVINDINPELVNLYKVVRDNPGDLIDDLQKHVYEKEYFYKIREVDRYPTYTRWSDIEKASRFIYLNKTCFNGLYRVNSKGHFNVPFGRYKNPRILDEPNLRACSRALQGVEIKEGSFTSAIQETLTNDFVYFDPPYIPLNATSDFTSYTKEKFDFLMQLGLRDLCCELNKRSVKFMLSNSSAPLVFELYKDFNIETVGARRSINSKGTKRGEVSEVIVTNF